MTEKGIENIRARSSRHLDGLEVGGALGDAHDDALVSRRAVREEHGGAQRVAEGGLATAAPEQDVAHPASSSAGDDDAGPAVAERVEVPLEELTRERRRSRSRRWARRRARDRAG